MLAAASCVAPLRASAGTSAFDFAVATQANIVQFTEDFPTATGHPQLEGEYGYSYTNLSSAGGSALADVLWPGPLAANAGTLIEVLTGSSSLTALNDPVRAQAGAGGSQTKQSTTTPTGTEMTASVVPPNPGDEYAYAKATTAGGGLGAVGSVGNSTSTSTIYFNSAANALTSSTSSAASDLSINGGLVKIGSVRSSAEGVSAAGAQPQMKGSLAVSDLTIAGQKAYVDGAGVHMGSPGQPASPAQQDAVNSALSGAGMQIYFTTPHYTPIGANLYYYAASVLFYWHPPNNSHDDTFTATVGGAAISMTTSPGFSWSLPSAALPPSPPLAGTSNGASLPATGSHGSSLPRADTSLALPAPPAGANGGSTPDLSPAASQPTTPPPAEIQGAPVAASANLPAGLGGWWLLILLGAVGGAALLTRVPALLATSSSRACPHGTPTMSHRRVQA